MNKESNKGSFRSSCVFVVDSCSLKADEVESAPGLFESFVAGEWYGNASKVPGNPRNSYPAEFFEPFLFRKIKEKLIQLKRCHVSLQVVALWREIRVNGWLSRREPWTFVLKSHGDRSQRSWIAWTVVSFPHSTLNRRKRFRKTCFSTGLFSHFFFAPSRCWIAHGLYCKMSHPHVLGLLQYLAGSSNIPSSTT